MCAFVHECVHAFGPECVHVQCGVLRNGGRGGGCFGHLAIYLVGHTDPLIEM